MATFIALIRETREGETHIADSVSRAASFQKEASSLGITVKDIYWTLGQYDGVLVFDAPDDETAAAAMVKLMAKGAVRTHTLRAFTAEDMKKILGH